VSFWQADEVAEEGSEEGEDYKSEEVDDGDDLEGEGSPSGSSLGVLFIAACLVGLGNLPCA
jgi:hypothetical protein